MSTRRKRHAQSSMPSLTTWLVVFLIVFLLVMVLVFSQYRKKIRNEYGGLGQFLWGNSSGAQSHPIAAAQRYSYPNNWVDESFLFHPPQLHAPSQRPINLTPGTNNRRTDLKPVQGYGFVLADQLMV